jgi:hypothetical protein
VIATSCAHVSKPDRSDAANPSGVLPLGLILLAEDVLPLRRARDRFLEWIEHHRPNWFTTNKHAGGD